MTQDDSPRPAAPWLKPLALGTVAAAGAVILAPYLLPALGLGTENMALQSINAVHGETGGAGLAGLLNDAMAAIPGIGGELAQGGTFTAFASGAVGIGGILLGNHVRKKESGGRAFSMGRLIRTASLITSALIALPSILTGISIGMVYLAAALGDTALASSVAGVLYNTLGAMGTALQGPNLASGAFAALPHIASCGAAILPAALTLRLNDAEAPAPGFETRIQPPPEPQHNPRYTDGSILATLRARAPLVAGKPCDARITLTHKDTGAPVTSDELATADTRKLHLFVVDQSLKDYHHLHPTPTGTPGEFAFSFTPHTPNSYHAWADVTLRRDGRNHRLRTVIPCALERPVRAFVSTGSTARKDDLVFDWATSAPLRQDTPAVVELRVTDPSGRPVADLQPVMGAAGHLIGFSADGRSMIHAQPLDGVTADAGERAAPVLRFQLEPDFSGPAQFYLQVKRADRESTVSFGQQIAPPQLNTRKIVSRHHGHGHAHG